MLWDTSKDVKKLPKQLTVVNEAAATIDLTDNIGEKQVTQYIRTPLSFAYAQRSIKESDIFIDLVISGKRSNPTIEINPKIKAGDENMKIKLYKVDSTKYSDIKASAGIINIKNATLIYPSTNKFGKYIKSIKDYPCEKENSNREHSVTYIAVLEKSDYQPKYLTYNQADIGISTLEVVLILCFILLFLSEL